jgi:phage replication-related protein YjqB (UPF0714/DUF867 family)
VIAVHGCSGAERITFLGGLDYVLRNAIRDSLIASGFATAIHSNPNLQGVHPGNICNRGRLGRGVQLEMSRGLRTELLTSVQSQTRTNRMIDFARSIRRALNLS